MFVYFIYLLKEPAFSFVDIFCYSLFCYFFTYFCSDLYDLFPSTNFRVLHFFFFSGYFKWKVWLFIWCFSCFLRQACIAMNLPLSSAFTESYRLWVVVFLFSFVSMHILISFFISSMLCWLFRSVLFSLHMFLFLIGIFFPCSWNINLPHCDQKRFLNDFKNDFFLIYQGYIYGPEYDLSWRMLCVYLRKRWNPLFWGEMCYGYQLGLTGPLYHLKFCFLANFMFGWSIDVWDIIAANSYCVIVNFTFNAH